MSPRTNLYSICASCPLLRFVKGLISYHRPSENLILIFRNRKASRNSISFRSLPRILLLLFGKSIYRIFDLTRVKPKDITRYIFYKMSINAYLISNRLEFGFFFFVNANGVFALLFSKKFLVRYKFKLFRVTIIVNIFPFEVKRVH